MSSSLHLDGCGSCQALTVLSLQVMASDRKIQAVSMLTFASHVIQIDGALGRTESASALSELNKTADDITNALVIIYHQPARPMSSFVRAVTSPDQSSEQRDGNIVNIGRMRRMRKMPIVTTDAMESMQFDEKL